MLVVAGCARGSFRVSHRNCCEWVFFSVESQSFLLLNSLPALLLLLLGTNRISWSYCRCALLWHSQHQMDKVSFLLLISFFPQKTNKFQWEESKKEEVAPTQVHHSCWSTQNLPPPNCLLRQISFMVAELQFCGDLGFTPKAQSCVWVLRTNWCWNLWFNLKAVCAWI